MWQPHVTTHLAQGNKMPMKAIIYIEPETLHKGNTVFIAKIKDVVNILKVKWIQSFFFSDLNT